MEKSDFPSCCTEMSMYFVDVLKDDLCSRNKNGWYSLKEDQPPKVEVPEVKETKYNNGPWSPEEH